MGLRQIFIFVLLVSCRPCLFAQGGGVDSLLKVLDQQIAGRESYLDQKLKRIDALRNKLNAVPAGDLRLQFSYVSEMTAEYRDVIYDSAFVYVHKMSRLAHTLGDAEMIADARLEASSLFLGGGVFTLAVDTLRTMRPPELDTSLKKRYYTLSARLWYDLAGYIGDQFYAPLHVALGNRYQDSLIMLETPGSDAYRMAVGKKLTYEHRYREAIDTLLPLLDHWDTSNRRFPILGSTLSFCYRSLDEEMQAKQMLIMAVISDIINVKMESTTAMQLAEMFYSERNLERAHQCIQLAQKSADYFNARHRKVRISKTLPLIETERMLLEQEKRHRVRLFATVVAVFAALVVLFLAIIYKQLQRIKRSEQIIRRTNRSLEETNLKLRESNTIKDEYIVDFLDAQASFIDRTDAHLKVIRKKMREKSYDTLMRLLDSELVEEERQQLFKRFDTVFLGLFPSFIEDFNALLEPDGRIVPRKNELLNTELRIYALRRLGINEPTAVAKFLNCSLNTIYAYKTRINNKALSQDKREFDRAIMSIGIRIQ